jgi:hypothetical protein
MKSGFKKNKGLYALLIITGLLIIVAVIAYFVFVGTKNNYSVDQSNQTIPQGATMCNPGQRNSQLCITVYDPVCGWFDKEIKCLKYPCANTFSNSCVACSNPNVEYYTSGDCPK